VFLLAFIRTNRVSRVLAVKVGLVSAHNAPSEFARWDVMFILYVNLDLFLDFGTFILANL